MKLRATSGAGHNTAMRKARSRMDRGFTIVELMIVVGIIGLIASLAIPNYLRFTARASRGEMMETLSKIKLSFKNLYDNTGSFVTSIAAGTPSGVNPGPPPPGGGIPVGQSAPWNPAAPGWADFQFPPEGGVKMRYWYQVASDGKSMIITVCGHFPGLGDPVPAGSCPADLNGEANYSYREVFYGTGISDPPVEFPSGLF